ncbi:hypothetical protein Moror_17180 [Moniliophthora roreri MCA 2997]|uniref:Uncharacterized protein n=1 Tax=Moniliophthora roreri (strain MCA 2997) TaxID=1381753 RepID=V2XFB9_MONRO|nr:hypothetical protein Moror_17180 [Moniliophthora roreri MCA 2997]
MFWSKGATPPYYALLTPVFGTPRNISIPDSSVTNGHGSFSMRLPFEKGQRIVITMSDATGFGSGGSTELLTVGSSQGGSCNVSDPGVAFDYELNTALQQCRVFTFGNYDKAIQPVTIMGIIPGGDSFVLRPAEGSTSYDWIANVWNGTSIIFVMVDAQFRPGGSSDVKIVGASDDTSCIGSNSPSSTMVPTATGTSPGATSTGSTSPPPASNGQVSTQIGAIAGTVLGALVFLAVFITMGLFFLQRKKNKKPGQIGWDAPQYSNSDPFASSPDLPTIDSPFTNDPFNPVSPSDQTYISDIEPFTAPSAGPSTMTSAQRKAAMAGVAPQKPSRFIVHTDAEDVPPEPEEEEVVELPPQYTERRARQ